MDLDKIINSKEYKNSKKKIEEWKNRISNGNKEEAVKVINEKNIFFSKMQETNPILYSAFEISDKTITEMAFEKITGHSILIY